MRWRLSPGTVIDGFELQEHLGTGEKVPILAVVLMWYSMGTCTCPQKVTWASTRLKW